jgi:hypothetical protein
VKRLNHKTGKPFVRGEIRHDGLRFAGYDKGVLKSGYFKERWVDPVRANLVVCLSDCRKTARKHSLPFDIDLEYLYSIMTDKCPIFKTPFIWDRYGDGYNTDWVPSLDKFYPELGYTKGNVTFISLRANRIKSNATEAELYLVADWFYEEKKKRNANKKSTTPLSAQFNFESETSPELGVVPPSGFGEDDDIYDDTGGAV